jgi:hypothetical protein
VLDRVSDSIVLRVMASDDTTTNARAQRREIDELIRRSSLGDSAWIDCPIHGRQATDPFRHGKVCVTCAAIEESDWTP